MSEGFTNLEHRLEEEWFPGRASGKESAANAEDTWDTGSTPGVGKSPGVGNGNPLEYSCLTNLMDRGVW